MKIIQKLFKFFLDLEKKSSIMTVRDLQMNDIDNILNKYANDEIATAVRKYKVGDTVVLNYGTQGMFSGEITAWKIDPDSNELTFTMYDKEQCVEIPFNWQDIAEHYPKKK